MEQILNQSAAPMHKNQRIGWIRRAEDRAQSQDVNFMACGIVSLFEQYPKLAEQRPEMLKTAQRLINNHK